MDQLRFTGLHEDGEHAVVTAEDGSEFLVVIDDGLRAAVRRPSAATGARTSPATPREVQTQIRAGASAEEVAERTGWAVERIERYEGPILAEREYVAGLARAASIRTHERSEHPPTLESRVRERLNRRGVDLDQVAWDSIRPPGGSWSVQVHFKAGQRSRSASWTFDLDTRSVDAIDDEARWLSEDEQSLPTGAAAAALLGGKADAPDDLMSAMRERSKRRGASGRRRKPPAATAAAAVAGSANAHTSGEPGGGDGAADDGAEGIDRETTDGEAVDGEAAAELDIVDGDQISEDPSAVPGQHDIPHAALPLEDLPYDPDTMGLPPAAGREADPSSGEEAVPPAGERDLRDADAEEAEEREATLADFFGSDDDEIVDEIGQDELDEDEVDEVTASDDGADADHTASSGPEEGEKAAPTGRKGRTSVPSWDDIMFGAKDRG